MTDELVSTAIKRAKANAQNTIANSFKNEELKNIANTTVNMFIEYLELELGHLPGNLERLKKEAGDQTRKENHD